LVAAALRVGDDDVAGRVGKRKILGVGHPDGQRGVLERGPALQREQLGEEAGGVTSQNRRAAGDPTRAKPPAGQVRCWRCGHPT
jgi:hypothetical protein